LHLTSTKFPINVFGKVQKTFKVQTTLLAIKLTSFGLTAKFCDVQHSCNFPTFKTTNSTNFLLIITTSC